MTTNQHIQFELNIIRTRDAFILDATSFAAANEEARAILADYCDGMTNQARANTYKSARLERYAATRAQAHFPENKTLLNSQAVTL